MVKFIKFNAETEELKINSTFEIQYFVYKIFIKFINYYFLNNIQIISLFFYYPRSCKDIAQ